MSTGAILITPRMTSKAIHPCVLVVPSSAYSSEVDDQLKNDFQSAIKTFSDRNILLTLRILKFFTFTPSVSCTADALSSMGPNPCMHKLPEVKPVITPSALQTECFDGAVPSVC